MGIIDSGVSILVIDDEELDCVIVKALIKKYLMNPQIDSCQNGKSAIDHLSKINNSNPKHLPDYIFLDLAMPVMNGWQFLAEFDRLKIDSLKKKQNLYTHLFRKHRRFNQIETKPACNRLHK